MECKLWVALSAEGNFFKKKKKKKEKMVCPSSFFSFVSKVSLFVFRSIVYQPGG